MTLQLTNHQIGLAAAGAAALGLSLADGLLQPVGRLAELRRSLRKTSTPPAGQGATPAPAAPILTETPESLAALPHVSTAEPPCFTLPAEPPPYRGDSVAKLRRVLALSGATLPAEDLQPHPTQP